MTPRTGTASPWPSGRNSATSPAWPIAITTRRGRPVRGRLDDAEDWYRKSLAIKEELGDKPGMAITYHQLGMAAQDRGGWMTPRTGTASPWPSRRNSATSPA